MKVTSRSDDFFTWINENSLVVITNQEALHLGATIFHPVSLFFLVAGLYLLEGVSFCLSVHASIC